MRARVVERRSARRGTARVACGEREDLVDRRAPTGDGSVRQQPVGRRVSRAGRRRRHRRGWSGCSGSWSGAVGPGSVGASGWGSRAAAGRRRWSAAAVLLPPLVPLGPGLRRAWTRVGGHEVPGRGGAVRDGGEVTVEVGVHDRQHQVDVRLAVVVAEDRGALARRASTGRRCRSRGRRRWRAPRRRCPGGCAARRRRRPRPRPTRSRG